MPNAEPCIREPSLTFHVGVTGARVLGADAISALRVQLAALLERVKNHVEILRNGSWATQRVASRLPSQPRAPLVVMVSPLAEGADRLAAAQALALGYELEAPLPFAQAEYEKDFPGSVDEFRSLLAQAGPRVLELEAARIDDGTYNYEAVGQLVVRRCDLLIAIWDGDKARGRGGTAEIVQYAAGRGRPIWWLRADGSGDACWIESLDDLRHHRTCACGEVASARLEAFIRSWMQHSTQAQ